MDDRIIDDGVLEQRSQKSYNPSNEAMNNDPSSYTRGDENRQTKDKDDFTSRTNHDTYSNNHYITDDNSLSDDQPLDFDDSYDFGFNNEQIQEYDVREKLQSLNAQLASEPFPPGSELRGSKVGFKEDIVSLVVPPDYYEPSESEFDDHSYNLDYQDSPGTDFRATTGQALNNGMQAQSFPETVGNMEQVYKGESNDKNGEPIVTNQTDDPNKDMVVSRGGEFQFLSSDDITGSSHKHPNEHKSRNGDKTTNIRKRPISAPATKRNRDHGFNFELGSSTNSDPNYRSSSSIDKHSGSSKYQIPRVDKDALSRQRERKKKEAEDNRKRDEEKQNMKKEVNEKVFNTWLQIKLKQKKDEDERRKIEEEEEMNKREKLQAEKKLQAQEIETELTKKLALEKRKEEKLRQYKLKEIEQSMTVHSDLECEKAFRDWLKKKQSEHQQKIKEERQNARITRLAMRQCRKSQNLAQAIQRSSSLRYNDFCEYP